MVGIDWTVEQAQRYAREILSGQRVRLRGLRDSDLASLTRWWQDPATEALQMTWVVPPSQAAAREMFERWTANQGPDVAFCIETVPHGDDDAHLVGTLALHSVRAQNRSATYAIGLGPPHQGKGYGSDATRVALRYAFREMNLHRVELHVMAFNERGVRAYQRAGFEIEGRRRDAVFHDGDWYDEIVMSALEPGSSVNPVDGGAARQ